jgi:acyl-CoA thioesterase-1
MPGAGSEQRPNPAGLAATPSGPQSVASDQARADASVASAPADAGSAGSPDGACTGTLGAQLTRANPLISRGVSTFSSPGAGGQDVDGAYHNGGWSAGNPTDAAPAWVALHLDSGPSRLLVSWDDGGTYNYHYFRDQADEAVYGLPGAYHIDVSADSTNGSDGTWQTQVDVTANHVRTRAHAIDFAGQSWVKLVITGAPASAANGVSIGEIDVHDLSATGSCLPEDTWFFMGDSITAFAYDRASIHQPSFATGINAASPVFFPAMINGGIGGETSTDALARLDDALQLNPDYRFFVLGYGTNDAGGGNSVDQYRTNLQSLIDRVKAAGRTPVIPHIPPSADGGHDDIPAYNTVIDELTAQNQLLPGADLYGYFSQNTGLFNCPPCANNRMTDNLHPNDDGLRGMNAVWTTAMRGLYP